MAVFSREDKVRRIWPYPTRFAPIAPFSLHRELDLKGILGDYHLLLAHIVLADPAAWAAHYGERRQRLGEPFVIMDNSSWELGQPLPAKLLLEAVRIVGARALVLPDKVWDGPATVELARENAEILSRNLPHGCALMAVAQGSTNTEGCACAADLARQIPKLGYFSVPRTLSDADGGRLLTVQYCTMHIRLPVHLLGLSVILEDDQECFRQPGVMGLDSAMPTWSEHFREYKPQQRGGRPKDFWEHSWSAVTATRNIRVVRKALGEGHGSKPLRSVPVQGAATVR